MSQPQVLAPPRAQAFDLFATRIWQLRLAQLAPRFPDWIEAVNAIRAAAPEPAGRTNRGGWNSRGQAFLERPKFAELRAAVLAQSLLVLGEMGMKAPHFFLQSWVNLHDRGGFNIAHMHEGCLLSGVFYLQVPDGSGNLVFRDPRPGAVNSPMRGAGPNASKDVVLRPEPGLLVIFPNWLEHYADVHQGDTPRICIPFNAVALARNAKPSGGNAPGN